MLKLFRRVFGAPPTESAPPQVSNEVVVDLTKEDGSVVQKRVPIGQTWINLYGWQVVAVSDNIAQLTCVVELRLLENAFVEIPLGVLAMTQLTELNLNENRVASIPREIGRFIALEKLDLSHNRLATIPREIGLLTALVDLSLDNNKLVALPCEIGQLVSLECLDLENNALTSLPAALGQLTSLLWLRLRQNSLAWLPIELDQLPLKLLTFNGNPLPLRIDDDYDRVDFSFGDLKEENCRRKLRQIFAATSHVLAVIREPAFVILTALQDLDLPALLLVEILDAAFPNAIPMHKKWDLVTAVKHYHQRH